MPAAGGALIVQKRDPTTDNANYNYGLWLYNDGTSGNGAEFFQFYDGSYEGMLANTLVSANVWHYLTVTVDETSATPIHFYLDGSPDGTPAYTGTMPANGSGPLQITNYDQSGGDYYLNGILDELRISSTARSPDWITAEYNNQSSPSTFYSVAIGN